MEPLISQQTGFVLLAVFGLVTLIASVYARKLFGGKDVDGFLLAGRKASWLYGGTSIAAAWTWSIALMISVQLAYQNGFAGIFWFVIPNILAVLIFIWIAPTIRKKLPNGYSLPEWISKRYGNKKVTTFYLIVFFYYQIMAIAMQIYAGGYLFSIATGGNKYLMMAIILFIVLIYTLVSGFKASLLTDLIQYSLLIIIGFIVSYSLLHSLHFNLNFSGVYNKGSTNPFSPSILFSSGIIMTISLLSASIGDQQFWQRSFAISEKALKKSFILGAVLFGIVPITLSFIGFVGAYHSNTFVLPKDFDMSLIGFVIVKNYSSTLIAFAFLTALLSGLSSTLDSALSATSSLYKMVIAKSWDHESIVGDTNFRIKDGRFIMIVCGLFGLGLAFFVTYIQFDLKYFWWSLNTLTSVIVAPTLLSIFSKGTSARGVLTGITLSVIIGIPTFVYGNLMHNDFIIAISYVLIVSLSFIGCQLFKNKDNGR
ncbi:sodium:solute symporter [Mucilaginibacter sp. OK098]|uniref:sodium:solute symporter family protein n=1 Tax=Mucilaginibacter sp. OK098 TaxID=1855297 RepID=UPI00090F6C84|nr:hypothetical protein [Mucilaginibacter sp. OK098]SHN26140.1 Na+/proline symporter [Mucilaginibacter sp. OK098]